MTESKSVIEVAWVFEISDYNQPLCWMWITTPQDKF